MKLWVDDIRKPPRGYVWCKSVNDTIQFIENTEKMRNKILSIAQNQLHSYNLIGYRSALKMSGRRDIELIDLDHDAGKYASDGGDYIKLLDWLEETGRNYPIRIHSMNPVGRGNMRRIIRKNGWTEID